VTKVLRYKCVSHKTNDDLILIARRWYVEPHSLEPHSLPQTSASLISESYKHTSGLEAGPEPRIAPPRSAWRRSRERVRSSVVRARTAKATILLMRARVLGRLYVHSLAPSQPCRARSFIRIGQQLSCCCVSVELVQYRIVYRYGFGH